MHLWMGRASLELVWGEGSCTDVSLWREVLIHVYRIYLPELQRLSIITKCNIMFLKSIKHVHKLSPSGREKISEHMWGLHNYWFFYRGENASWYEILSNLKKKLDDFYSNFQFKWEFFFNKCDFKSHVIFTEIYKVYHNSKALNDIHALPNIDLT